MYNKVFFLIIFLISTISNVYSQHENIDGCYKTQNKAVAEIHLEFFNFNNSIVEYFLYSDIGKWAGEGTHFIIKDSLYINFLTHPKDTFITLNSQSNKNKEYDILNFNIIIANDNLPLENVNVFVYDSLTNMPLKYSFTNRNGFCSIKIDKENKCSFVKIEKMGFHHIVIPCPHSKVARIYNYNIYLTEYNFYKTGNKKRYLIKLNKKNKIILKNESIEITYKKISKYKFYKEKRKFFR